MPRRLPTLTLAAGLTLAVFLIVRAARAEDAGTTAAIPVPHQEHPRVRVTFADKSVPPVEGTLKLDAVPLRTATGTRVVNVSALRRITFQKSPEGEPHDTVVLADKTSARGRVTLTAITVEPGDGSIKRYGTEAVREVTVIREHPVSLVSVLVGLVTLAAMEIVLGIDNIIFLAIVAGRLPPAQQPKARRIGLVAALGTRIVLLLFLSFLLGLTEPLFTLPDLPLVHDLEAREVSGRDLILFAGGLFLIGKSVREMHKKLEESKEERQGEPDAAKVRPTAGFAGTIALIAVIDIVFSLDSVITAVGMVDQVWVMVGGMVIAMLVMLGFAGAISRFVDTHPTIKVLALAFLILIGVMLVAEGLGQHIDKGYIYFAMAFAVGIEMINLRLRKGHPPAAPPGANC
jgi:predicted tellurium resistance membrane protein TerC